MKQLDQNTSLFDTIEDPKELDWDRTPRIEAQKITIVIPVFGALREVLICINSVLCSRNYSEFQLIVINDHGPVDNEYTVFLEALGSRGLFLYSKNDSNLGFVATANLGILRCKGDVLLLNSDTILPDAFIDRMVLALNLDETVASLSPLSNNATILSYPAINTLNSIASLEEFRAIDRAFEECDGASVELPVTVGYCMLIRRAALNDVGLFDEALFGIGYGEECDWCMRARYRGWKHRSVSNLFVYHQGSLSFSDRTLTRQKLAAAALAHKHPQYFPLVGEYCRADRLFPVRRHVDMSLLHALLSENDENHRAVIHVCHRLKGGTMTYVESIAGLLSEQGYRSILAIPNERGELLIGLVSGAGIEGSVASNIIFSCAADAQECEKFMKSLNPKLMHVHSLIGFSPEVVDLVTNIDLPKVFTLHDYAVICPQINLLDHTNRYCNLPDSRICNLCLLSKRSPLGCADIVDWRKEHLLFLKKMDAVIAPSQAARELVNTVFPDLQITVVENPLPTMNSVPAPAKYGSATQSLYRQIAVLGHIHLHKGEELLRAAARDAWVDKRMIQYVVFGSIDINTEDTGDRLVCQGEYSPGNLREMLDETDCKIGFLASVWPETFSYVLSEIIHEGLLPVVLDYGAPPERLRQMGFGYVIPANILASRLNDCLLKLPVADLAAFQSTGYRSKALDLWPVYNTIL